MTNAKAQAGEGSLKPPIVIVEYDPRWPAMFEGERARILAAVGPRIVGIEHIGSTAVPGLGAKPIIDIMAAVRRLSDATKWIRPLQDIGYEYVPEYEAEIPERRYFRRGPPEARTHHLHVVERTSRFWEKELLFRDFLRARPEEARRYERLKRDLAAKYGPDREGYTEAKTPFVEAAIGEARVSQRRSPPT